MLEYHSKTVHESDNKNLENFFVVAFNDKEFYVWDYSGFEFKESEEEIAISYDTPDDEVGEELLAKELDDEPEIEIIYYEPAGDLGDEMLRAAGEVADELGVMPELPSILESEKPVEDGISDEDALMDEMRDYVGGPVEILADDEIEILGADEPLVADEPAPTRYERASEWLKEKAVAGKDSVGGKLEKYKLLASYNPSYVLSKDSEFVRDLLVSSRTGKLLEHAGVSQYRLVTDMKKQRAGSVKQAAQVLYKELFGKELQNTDELYAAADTLDPREELVSSAVSVGIYAAIPLIGPLLAGLYAGYKGLSWLKNSMSESAGDKKLKHPTDNLQTARLLETMAYVLDKQEAGSTRRIDPWMSAYSQPFLASR
ncbi:MAG: hypothetical protein GOU99_03295 [Candidatus Altiarchaeota archaeon]|nr:hypothetical protein [Candidatus Altiarchaeota archaeon]